MLSGVSSGAFHRERPDGRIEHRAEPVMLVLALLVIPAIVLEQAASDELREAAFALNVLIWVGFSAELAYILYVATSKRRTLRAHWLDAVIVLVSFPFLPVLLQSARALRLLRLLRLVRLTALGGRAFVAARRIFSPSGFRYIALLVVFVVIAAAGAIALVDSKDVNSYWDGLWWAIVTVTTVGYGDIYPTTTEGRIVGIVLMIVGISFFALLTATIAATFVHHDEQEDIGKRLDEISERLSRIEQALDRDPDSELAAR
jgi:voltage-gated potassium channel